MDTTSYNIRDKFLALGFCVLLLGTYLAVTILTNKSTTFIENILLFMVGVFGGLLKSATTSVNNEKVDNVNIEKK